MVPSLSQTLPHPVPTPARPLLPLPGASLVPPNAALNECSNRTNLKAFENGYVKHTVEGKFFCQFSSSYLRYVIILYFFH